MCLGDCFGDSTGAEYSLPPEHLRYLGSFDLGMEVRLHLPEMNRNNLIPFSVVEGWVDVEDVRLEPVSGGLVYELLLVRGRNDHYSVFRPKFTQFSLYLRQYLVARWIASPEDCVGLIEEQDTRALLANHPEEVFDPFLRVPHVVCTAHQFASSHFDEAHIVLGSCHHSQ